MSMREFPIIFTTSMVQAIQEGRKTQTRRVINRLRGFGYITEFGPSETKGYDWHFRDKRMRWNDITQERLIASLPYQPGDLLWVRETWANISKPGYPPEIIYKADDDHHDPANDAPGEYEFDGGKWRSPYHLFKKDARLWLEVVSVRVERVQDISEWDARAEGWPAERELFPAINTMYKVQRWYRGLWDSLNAKRGYGWEQNPWVWVIEFKRSTHAGAGCPQC
jgi:hypothetical protein